ncbi:MBL fold metallo-hydrolase [Sulfuricurvum sp.]|uniref:MBL fold metallo-hydrolase n=1 Tax=Sulfuricurvum sp. TaxID=2025608 RepID=UPI003564A842
MEILVQPMGAYQTNCYIVKIDGKEIIIDPGIGATGWVMANVTNPVAILNTHGHFDHVWSNQELKEALNIPLYTPKADVFLLQNSTFMPDLPASYPDVEVEGDKIFAIAGIEVKFHHFPGHCPGCSMIEIGDAIFSGDFIFHNSIGRWDFPYSDGEAMKESLQKFAKMQSTKTLYPGHGGSTTVPAEQRNIDYWIRSI